MNRIRKVACNLFFATRYMKAMQLLECSNVQAFANGTWITTAKNSELVFAHDTKIILPIGRSSVKAIVDGQTVSMRPYDFNGRKPDTYIVIQGDISNVYPTDSE